MTLEPPPNTFVLVLAVTCSSSSGEAGSPIERGGSFIFQPFSLFVSAAGTSSRDRVGGRGGGECPWRVRKGRKKVAATMLQLKVEIQETVEGKYYFSFLIRKTGERHFGTGRPQLHQ
jgi:hypothetical protein